MEFYINEGVLKNSDPYLESKCSIINIDFKSITIPTSVSKLGSYCFSDCSNLSSIRIPTSVLDLGVNCFENCIGLSSITIPTSVSRLGEQCLCGCTNLSSITFPENIIYNLLFNYCVNCIIETSDHVLTLEPIPISIKQNTKYIRYVINEHKELYLDDVKTSINENTTKNIRCNK